MIGPIGQLGRTSIHLAVLGVAVAGSYAALKAPVVPFAWLCLTWCLVLLYLGFAAREPISRAVWVNLSAALLAFALGEVYLWSIKLEKTNTYCCGEEYFVGDDALGVVPRKNFTASHVKAVNSVPIYKITYSIDAWTPHRSPI